MKPARRNWTYSLVVASLVALAAGASGCVVRGHATATYDDPPPPRYVEVDERPGYVWIQGRWVWQYNQWQWTEGRWVRERQGHYYTQGYWSTQGSRRVWVNGTWARGRRPAGVYTRDHRTKRAPATRSQRGPTWKAQPQRRDTRSNGRGAWGNQPNNSRGNRNTGPAWKRGNQPKRSAPPPRVNSRDHRKATPYKKPDKKEDKKKKPRVYKRDHR